MKLLKKLTAAAAILGVAALTACGAQTNQTQEQAAAPAEQAGQAVTEEAGEDQASAEAVTSAAGETAAAAETAAPASDSLTVAAVSRSVGDLWLLSGGQLAGMTEDGMDLEGITEDTQVIGTVTNPSLEAIAALSPDLVLLSGELPTHKKLAGDLESRNIPCKMISVNSFADYDAVMQELTAMTGREDCYTAAVTEVRERIDQILEEAADRDLRQGTYLALRVSATKNKALKNDYFACEILNDFGLVNIAQDNEALDELNIEAILDADPDMIFVIEQGKSDEAQGSFEENFSGKPVWKELTAVKDDHVYNLPKDFFQYKPNAKWDEAYLYVRELLEK